MSESRVERQQRADHDAAGGRHQVNMMVKRMPSKNRYGSERMMTSQSILENIVRPQCAAAGWPMPMKPGTATRRSSQRMPLTTMMLMMM